MFDFKKILVMKGLREKEKSNLNVFIYESNLFYLLISVYELAIIITIWIK
jgi:hypothetical protein